MKKVLISLVNYKNHEVTKTCLTSLEKLSLREVILTIVVVNNDTAKEFSFSWKGEGELMILNQKENLGFSGGHNVSLKKASDERLSYVLILNNDTTISPDFLTQLLYEAEKHENQGVFGPMIYFSKGQEFHKEKYSQTEKGKVIWYAGGKIDWKNLILSHRGVDEVDTGQYIDVVTTDFVSGCCMLLPLEVIQKIGIFDERYFLYLEDSDLNMRIKNAGYKAYFVPQAKIWHDNAGSTGGSGSSLQDYYISRNRLLFGFTFAPLRTRIALVRESLRMFRSGREWQKKGVTDFYFRRLGKGRYHV